jgi:hypothetical protein
LLSSSVCYCCIADHDERQSPPNTRLHLTPLRFAAQVKRKPLAIMGIKK